MGADQFGHFEHRNLVFAKNWAQLIVSINVATVFRVLKVVLFNVVLELFGDFGTRQRCSPDNGGQRVARGQWLHERRIWFARGFCSSCHKKLLHIE